VYKGICEARDGLTVNQRDVYEEAAYDTRAHRGFPVRAWDEPFCNTSGCQSYRPAPPLVSLLLLFDGSVSGQRIVHTGCFLRCQERFGMKSSHKEGFKTWNVADVEKLMRLIRRDSISH
jgi:hypothetical protein